MLDRDRVSNYQNNNILKEFRELKNISEDSVEMLINRIDTDRDKNIIIEEFLLNQARNHP